MATFQPAGAIRAGLATTLSRGSSAARRSRIERVASSLMPSATTISKPPGGASWAKSDLIAASMDLSSLRAAMTTVTATAESVLNAEHNRGSGDEEGGRRGGGDPGFGDQRPSFWNNHLRIALELRGRTAGHVHGHLHVRMRRWRSQSLLSDRRPGLLRQLLQRWTERDRDDGDL